MTVWEYETEHLGVDHLDRVFILDCLPGDFGWLFIGCIDEDPRWPVALGPEPNWFLTELGMLLDVWTEGLRFGAECRCQVEYDYRRAKGRL